MLSRRLDSCEKTYVMHNSINDTLCIMCYYIFFTLRVKINILSKLSLSANLCTIFCMFGQRNITEHNRNKKLSLKEFNFITVQYLQHLEKNNIRNPNVKKNLLSSTMQYNDRTQSSHIKISVWIEKQG